MSGLNNVGLLGLINMPHFGQLNEANACVKQLLAYFHGGTLWFDTPVKITVDLISDITRFSKDRPDPSYYFRGNDNDKKLAVRLKNPYGLECGERDYRINSIDDQEVHISTRILAIKMVKKNHVTWGDCVCRTMRGGGTNEQVTLFYELVGRGHGGSTAGREVIYIYLVIDFELIRGLDGANQLSRHGHRSGESV